MGNDAHDLNSLKVVHVTAADSKIAYLRPSGGKSRVTGDLHALVAEVAICFPDLKWNLLTCQPEGDVDASAVRYRIEAETTKLPSQSNTKDAMEIVRKSRKHDPLLDHINALPTWARPPVYPRPGQTFKTIIKLSNLSKGGTWGDKGGRHLKTLIIPRPSLPSLTGGQTGGHGGTARPPLASKTHA